MGTGSFSLPALEVASPHVVAVVTQPDRPVGRGMKPQPSLVKQRAEELGLKVYTPEKCKDPEFVEFLKSLEADFLLVAAYGQILSQAVLDCTRLGGINLHGSLLPKYRGAAPIQRCLMAGDKMTGITLMQMDKGMDTGGMIHKESLTIKEGETYGELQIRLAHLAEEMCKVWLPKIQKGDYSIKPQDSSLATMAPKIIREDGLLRFKDEVHSVYHRYLGTIPHPGAYIETQWGRLKIIQAKLGSLEVTEPGKIVSLKPFLEVGFGNGSLILEKVQAASKKVCSGTEWANGMRLRVGNTLESKEL